MANDYFNHSANRITSGVRALASQVNNIADEVGAGLDALPSIANFKYQTNNYAVDTGAADAYVGTLTYVPSALALTDGWTVRIRPINTNTGASTLNINNLGAKAIVFFDGTALTANAIVAGYPFEVQYSSTADSWVLMSAGAKTTSLTDADSLGGVLAAKYIRNDTAQTIAFSDSSPLISLTQSGTGASIIVNNAPTADIGIGIDNYSASAPALQIQQLAATARGIYVANSTSGAGYVGFWMYNNNSSRTADMMLLEQDDGSASADVLVLQQDGTGAALNSTGRVLLNGLPTSDPTVAGELWNNSGVLTVSAG